MFAFYLQFGFDHLLDWRGYDHMLFLLVLCAGYTVKEWRRTLILITAFTIGHSITLGVGALGIQMLSSYVVELLIPITIFLTAMDTWLKRETKFVSSVAMTRKYVIAGVFGLIHGMGFSTQFIELESEKNLLLTWLPFNIGIELGQIIFVAIIAFLGWIIRDKADLSMRHWKSAVAILAAGLALWMMWERM